MCRDNAALGGGITSRVIRSERAERGADISHQSAGRRRADSDSDDEAWDAERDPGDGRKQRLRSGSCCVSNEQACFCRGRSHHGRIADVVDVSLKRRQIVQRVTAE
ncbi:hypothetical protein NQZ68_018775 [Dissostichus eleginoides]|nr:hypothetical protein NQZ68_018775 [Dissostichus eleginoides]